MRSDSALERCSLPLAPPLDEEPGRDDHRDRDGQCGEQPQFHVPDYDDGGRIVRARSGVNRTLLLGVVADPNARATEVRFGAITHFGRRAWVPSRAEAAVPFFSRMTTCGGPKCRRFYVLYRI
jgi:hypothetical protein